MHLNKLSNGCESPAKTVKRDGLGSRQVFEANIVSPVRNPRENDGSNLFAGNGPSRRLHINRGGGATRTTQQGAAPHIIPLDSHSPQVKRVIRQRKQFVVEGCGVQGMNGTYTESGVYDGVPTYSMQGTWKKRQVKFTLRRFASSGIIVLWYISIFPGDGIEGKTKVDFYYGLGHFWSDLPPQTKWAVSSEGLPSTPTVSLKESKDFVQVQTGNNLLPTLAVNAGETQNSTPKLPTTITITKGPSRRVVLVRGRIKQDQLPERVITSGELSSGAGVKRRQCALTQEGIHSKRSRQEGGVP